MENLFNYDLIESNDDEYNKLSISQKQLLAHVLKEFEGQKGNAQVLKISECE